jgi:hypothetical protein
MTLDKQDWQQYFDRLSRSVIESRSEADVAVLPRGLRTDASWVALVAVHYNAERDLIEIAFEMADKTTEDYVIDAPRAVSIDEDAKRVAAIEVIDCNGAAHRVEFREPVAIH